MKITPIVNHLKQYVPLVGGRVAAIVNFQREVIENPRLIRPALYVMAGSRSGQAVRPNRQTYIQGTEQPLYLFLVLNNTRDEIGFAAQDMIDEYQQQLDGAIVNWWMQPPYDYPIEFVMDDLHFENAALYIHRFEYMHKTQIDYESGYKKQFPALSYINTSINLANASEETRPNAVVDLDFIGSETP